MPVPPSDPNRVREAEETRQREEEKRKAEKVLERLRQDFRNRNIDR